MQEKETGSPPKSISRETAEHYTWGNGCDGWHLIKDPSLSVIEERMPPGTSEVRHYHRQAQQLFFILSGQALMEVDGETIRLSAGEGLPMAPGRRHQIGNDSGDPVRFLVISQPPSHGDRMVE